MVRAVAQIVLGGLMLAAGVSHLTTLREEFRAQVPPWLPLDADLVVVASGFVEVVLGLAMLAIWRQPARRWTGVVLALFFVAVFPGNVAQLVEGRDAFGLDTDAERAARLLFQPVLIAWALRSTRTRAAAPGDQHPRAVGSPA